LTAFEFIFFLFLAEEATKEDKVHPTSKHDKEFINNDIADLVIEREKPSLTLPVHSRARARRASNPRELIREPFSPCRPYCYPLSMEVAPALVITEPKLEKSHPRIPDENMVTCNVEVHCEKSPENPDGVDNLAFIGSDSSHSIKNTIPNVPCHEKSISENG
jgi:hypothetical protein